MNNDSDEAHLKASIDAAGQGGFMGQILDMRKKAIAKAMSKPKPSNSVTQATAAAIITSEIDIAIENWNKRAIELAGGIERNASLFRIEFTKYEYSKEAKEKSGHFGYGELTINLVKNGQKIRVYNKAISHKTEQKLDNTNGYYPELILDCLGMLLAAGLLYNLVLQDQTLNDGNSKESPEPKDSKAGKPGTGSKRRPRS